mmetsp:Transcript_1480/g.1557  ORF Transcript_1480/g.1557 Transcript_1480/m.1557 type:complete len:241 (-) Transcript_1480:228-950(-)|eukprot:CAMPEP_0182423174 /NCGR_PEP_ID=MMETSP1167-20130531/9073_1 /TAXON_ID=2988 /ORGANISM="Mallomonas Sp, Strain CCMP3275" /LENGTH=240 /DNA_ID=CAMNT_0024601879 /DNA_START=13 /DNA_END=735 /DNA_ORIENTATION=-
MKSTRLVRATADHIFNVPTPTLSIVGSELRFPVRRVYCVAQNYSEHVIEMGKNPERESPFFFTKPADAIVDCSTPKQVRLPPHSKQVDWECEVVVAIGRGGSFIPPEKADTHIFGYAMGVDLTARDLQKIAKAAGRPWDLAKGFDFSAPIGKIARKDSFGPIDEQNIMLSVNGVLKQSSSVDKMIWSIPLILSHLSSMIHVREGDLIFTGTPHGIGALKDGDKILCCGDGLPSCEFSIQS